MDRLSLPRREFWDMSVKALRDGRVAWLGRQAAKLVTIPLGDALGRPLTGPVFGTLMLTYRCNNACKMCDYPRRGAADASAGRREMDTAQIRTVLEDFAAIGTTGMALIGGEPTLRPDLDEILRAIKDLGMVANITTNGSMLADARRAAALLRTGIDLVNFSIDGADAATHDGQRGRPGNFDAIRQAVGHLARLRADLNPGVVINAVSVLTDRNVHQAAAIARAAVDMGCDRVGFMPVHRFPYMAQPMGRPGDPAWLDEVARAVADLKALRGHLAIDNSDAYLDRFVAAFSGVPSDLRCYVGFTTTVIDPYGDVFACEPWVRTRPPVGNVLQTPLRTLWSSPAYNRTRAELAACRDCYWNCTTELNVLFNGLVPFRKPARSRP
jgi:MoaA/NifB/PqqE/SkfB family radical SAM enzyme